MRSIVNLFFLLLCCRLVATTSFFVNGISAKTHNLEKNNVFDPRLPNSAHNSFRGSDNIRYHPNDPNYLSPPDYNFVNYYNNYNRPLNLPHFPQVPKNHQAQYPKPPPYNILKSYNSTSLIRPINPYLPNDKQKHVLNEVKPVHPTGNIKFEEKLHERVVKPTSDVRNIISKPLIRNHYISNQKKYMIIYPNGTVDDVDYVEPAVTENSNYVFVNGADIIPIKNRSPVKIIEHESYTSGDLKNAPVLQLDDPVNQQESPKPQVQVIVEGPVENKYQNHNLTVISSSKVSDSNSLINNIPTTIIEIDPQFTNSSDNNVTKTQPEENDVNTRSSVNDDIIRNANFYEGLINETTPIENTTEEIDLQKNKFVDKVSTIEDDTSDILDKPIILTNDTNITLINSEEERLFDEAQLLLETNKESNNNTNSFIEASHNETSNQFKKTKDFLVNLLPTENSTEIVKNNDLLTDKESNSTTTVAWGDTSNNTGENYGKKFSDVNISSTPTVGDITTASVTTPLVEKELSLKLHGFQNFNLNNAGLPNSALNSFHIPDYRRYHPNNPNYLSPPNYNFPNYYNNYLPPNLPYFPQVPKSHQAQYPKPPPYNILKSYNSTSLIRPTKYLPTDKQRHVLNEVKPVYPTGNIKFEEKLHETLVKPPSDVRNIILKPTIRNHYASNQKKYMIIYPNGTVDDVDNLEPDVTEHQNYVLVNGADVIPTKNVGPVQTFDHKIYTTNNLKNAPQLHINRLVNEHEAPTLKIQLNEEGPLDNRFQNNHDFIIDSPSKVYNTLTGTLFNNTPTTIIEMDPQFIISSDNDVTKTQQEEAVNTTSSVDVDIIRSEDLIEGSSKKTVSSDLSTKLSDELLSFELEPEAKISFDPFIDFEDDIIHDSFDQIRKNMAKPLEENVSSHDIETIARLDDDFRDLFISTQINETKSNENATDEIYLDNNTFSYKIPTIEDDTGDILDKLTILSNNTNIASLNSQQERLFDDVHLLLETNKEPTFHDNASSSSIDSLYNETSNQFRETEDLPVNLLPTENPAEIVKNIGLSADKERDGPKSSASVAWSDISNNTKDNNGNESSGVNTSSTTIVGDISDATDDITPTATEERSVYFKIDKDFWEKLKHKEIPFDVVYFFELQEPVVKKGVKAITYPNGTVVTYDTLHDVEDNRPILIKNIDIN